MWTTLISVPTPKFVECIQYELYTFTIALLHQFIQISIVTIYIYIYCLLVTNVLTCISIKLEQFVNSEDTSCPFYDLRDTKECANYRRF